MRSKLALCNALRVLLAEEPAFSCLECDPGAAARHGMEAILEEARERLGQSRESNRRLSYKRVAAICKMELLELGERFAAAGLPLLVFKGGALLFTLYRDSGWRPLRDLDLLVRPADLAPAVRLLMESGYRPAVGGYARKGMLLDLHTDLLGSERIPSRRTAWGLSGPQVWEQARPLAPGLWEPDPAVHFQLLALHALKHSYSRLIWLADLAFLTRAHPHLLLAARGQPTEAPVRWASALLTEALGLPPGPFGRPTGVPAWYLSRIASGRATVPLGEVLAALAQPSVRQQVVYLRDLVLPPRAVLRELYPGTPAPLLEARRLLDLLLRSGQTENTD